VKRLAAVVYPSTDQGAALSSGSFVTMGMVVAPCSMKTLGEIAAGVGDGLVARAADVVLKERRRLVLAVREAPFHQIHLENMLRLTRMGAIISPPVPAFYNHPRTVDDIVNHTVTRLLDLFGIHTDDTARWDGRMEPGGAAVPGSVDV
jgi:flavin prenyltransferase